MPRTKISKEEGGGFRITIKPNNASEQPMVSVKFPDAAKAKAGIPAVRELWIEKRAARRARQP